MKKIIYIVMSLLLLGTASIAQNKSVQPPVKKAKAPASKNVTTTKKTTAVKTKKDGTPDKRFKENKAAPKPAVHLKKDGTPDKRFKANKTAAKPTAHKTK